MQKLKAVNYYNSKGERKVNCYMITISKEAAKNAGFDIDTKLEVKAENGKIFIEKV